MSELDRLIGGRVNYPFQTHCEKSSREDTNKASICFRSLSRLTIKGTVHPKINILSSSPSSHFKYDCLLSVEKRKENSEQCFHSTAMDRSFKKDKKSGLIKSFQIFLTLWKQTEIKVLI